MTVVPLFPDRASAPVARSGLGIDLGSCYEAAMTAQIVAWFAFTVCVFAKAF